MTVASILANKGTEVTTVDQSDTVAQVCSVLAEHKIGAVIVVSSGHQIEGIVSERDVVRAISETGAAVLATPVSSIMTSSVVTCSKGDTTNAVMAKMTEGRFRHVPVIEGGRLAGLISIGDVVKEKIAQAEADAEMMRTYISTV